MKSRWQKIKPYLKKKRVLIPLAIIILIIILALVKNNTGEERQTYVVEQRDVANQVLIAGRVQADQRADIGFDTSGRIANLDVEPGDTVTKGQVLARLSLGQEYADLAAARADLDIARADTSQASGESAAAEREFAVTKAEQDALVANARQTYLSNDLQAYSTKKNNSKTAPTITGTYFGDTEGEYALEVYKSNARSGFSFRLSGIESGTYTGFTDRPGRLGESGLYIQFPDNANYGDSTWTIPVPNTRSNTYAAARSTYDAAVTARDRVLAGADDELARDQARINQAQARVNAAGSRVSDGVIRAPFEGVIGAVGAENGESVSAGQTIVTVVSGDEYKLLLDVPEIDVAKLSLDQTVEVSLDAYANQGVWTGAITSIAPAESYVDGIPVYQTKVVIQDPDERIRSGMSAQAYIDLGNVQGVLAIPEYFLERDGGTSQYYVTLLDSEGNESRQFVTPGLFGSDGFVEILEGLTEGQTIVTLIAIEEA